MRVYSLQDLAKRKKKSRSFNFKSRWMALGSNTIYVRSGWEAKVAIYLQKLQEGLQIAKWEFEPHTFWFLNIKRGVRSYLPDFKVTNLDGSHYWLEVKGYMDAKSKTKIKRFRKYYPEERLIILDKEWFMKNL